MCDQPPQCEQHGGADEDEKKIVAGQRATRDGDGAAQAGGARTKQVLRAPDRENHVLDDEHDCECREQLEHFRCAVQMAQQLRFHQRAKCRDEQCGEQHRRPIADPTTQRADQAVREVGAQHHQ